MNGELIYEGHTVPYSAKSVYNENFIGYKSISNKEGNIKTLNSFKGQMSTLHFIGINKSTHESMHNILTKIYPLISMNQLFPVLAYEEAYDQIGIKIKQTIQYKDLINSIDIDRIFFLISPKYASKKISQNENLFLGNNLNGKQIKLTNHIVLMYKHTHSLHATPAKNILANLDGVNCLLPFLYELGEFKIFIIPEIPNRIVAKCLEIIKKIWEYDQHNRKTTGKIKEEIVNLRYLLGRLAIQSGLTIDIYKNLRNMMEYIEEFYFEYTENFLEMLLLNMDIWKHSTIKVQEQIVEDIFSFFILQNHKNFSNHKIIDILLNCIEIFANVEQESNPRIKKLSKIILYLAKNDLTKEVLGVIMGYLNIYFLRRLKCYPRQIYYILEILLDIFNNCTQVAVEIIVNTLKSKKEVKLFSTIFTILDYFLFIKEYGFLEEYKGITYSNNCSDFEQSEENNNNPKKRNSSFLQDGRFFISEEGKNIIDSIVSMCIYWILSFDWQLLSEYMKEYPRNDLGLFLLRTLSKTTSRDKNSIISYYI